MPRPQPAATATVSLTPPDVTPEPGGRLAFAAWLARNASIYDQALVPAQREAAAAAVRANCAALDAYLRPILDKAEASGASAQEVERTLWWAVSVSAQASLQLHRSGIPQQEGAQRTEYLRRLASSTLIFCKAAQQWLRESGRTQALYVPVEVAEA